MKYKICVTCGRKFVPINGNEDFDMCNNCAMNEVKIMNKENTIKLTIHDVRLDVIKPKSKQQDIDNQGAFVKVKHEESGIVVTKFNKPSIKAKDEALAELDALVKIWNRE